MATLLGTLELRPLPAGAIVQASAVVEVVVASGESEGVRSTCFVAPVGGGLRTTVGGVSVQVVTPQSPLGAALLGKEVGDVVEVVTPQGKREYEILSVE
jgi:hypothetical protein